MQELSSEQEAQSAITGEWTTRPYREGDIPALVELINSIDAVSRLGRATSKGDLRNRMEMPGADLPNQVFFVEGPRPSGLPPNLPVAYGWLNVQDATATGTRIYSPRLDVHPAARGQGLELFIARRLLDMARRHEANPAVSRMAASEVNVYLRGGEDAKREVWEQAGLRDDRQFLTMARSLDEPIDEPAPVEGVEVRPYRAPEDNARGRIAFNSSFADHYDFHPDSQEEYDHGINSPSSRPDLSWLAEVRENPDLIAGFCICRVPADTNRRTGEREGWIDVLGTIRQWRGMGLGRALLLHGLHSLRAEGLSTALLHVDADSPTGANKLYESVGFRVRYHDTIMKAPLSEVRI